ncbi:hypothetical protein [Olleya sp. 1-3]|uniref:hypothetical protein n=1 Tax=Olleya sp. 1-3 TaxID=2058323 RepID=UPI0012FEA443|nr:hypothetical protein [Olleya sp. 1-3]
MKKRLSNFINNKNILPLLVGIASGLYPMLYYFNANYTQANSVSQLLFFSFLFIVVPVLIFSIFNYFSKKIKLLEANKFKLFVLLDIGFFGSFILISTFRFQLIYIIPLIIVALCCALFFSKHLKKIVVFQFLLVVMALVSLIPTIFKHVTYSKQWLEQPDAITKVIFKTTPNVYFIQVDGYANVDKLSKGPYGYENSSFNSYLKEAGFKNYSDYRSNYYSTLSSNSSLLAMKHHYYSNPDHSFAELSHARENIVSKNPVLEIFKNNMYKTHLLMDKYYFLLNRPTLGFDYSNIKYKDVPFRYKGLGPVRDVISDLKTVLPKDTLTSNFYFIQKLLPSHVTNSSSESVHKITEKENYLNKLQQANLWLQEIITLIDSQDKNALIIITADHGGFVGFNTTLEARIKQSDPDLIYSIYTAMLAIKWNGMPPDFDNKFKTPVNFFRILFSYLGENESYLDHLEDDSSYIMINQGAPFGVYKYIDNQGETVFEPLSN